MTKRHCFVTDVGIAIERLADALDPEREKPFRGDILDLLEWAARDVLTLSAENEKAWAEVAHVKEVEFPRKVAMVAENWRKKLASAQERIEGITESLRQQLTAAQAELEAERNRRFEGNRISSQEYNYSQKQVTLLRDVVWETIASRDAEVTELRKDVTLLRDAMEAAWQEGYAFCGAEGLSDVQKQFQAALAATEPKP